MNTENRSKRNNCFRSVPNFSHLIIYFALSTQISKKYHEEVEPLREITQLKFTASHPIEQELIERKESFSSC